jgi:hypothetical protein
VSIKQVEKLEVHVQELSIKIEELNRTIVDITSHKTRLSQVCRIQYFIKSYNHMDLHGLYRDKFTFTFTISLYMFYFSLPNLVLLINPREKSNVLYMCWG